MKMILRRLRELRRYPSAVAGLVLIVVFIGLSVYAMIALPYGHAIRLWRAPPGVWDETPLRAAPIWFDWFTRDKLPRTIIVSTGDAGLKRVEPLEDGRSRIEIVLPFDYDYDGFPSEVQLFTQATFEGTRTVITVHWRTPTGEFMPLLIPPVNPRGTRSIRATDTLYISQDSGLRTLLGRAPEQGLFMDRTAAIGPDGPVPVKGRYELVLVGEVLEGADLNAKLVVFGQVHGLAGTDHRRRDLTVALLWGAPLALAFGILGAIGANLSTFVLAGIGTWFGGKVDFIFQRITNINMILPLLPILIMIGQFYNRSLWLMLGVIIVLSVFSAAMLTYRAMFLQAKEAPYIEAAQAYGASNMRIVFRYLLPRIAPTLLPQFVLVIPSFVFLEATLAVLGLGDPVLPTWGKIMNDANTNGALYMGQYYWPLQPAILLMLMGFSFALVGYALDRVFNPKLRTV